MEYIAILCTGVCKGLEFIHDREKPIIHRDLKPGNIFISTSHNLPQDVKLGDFGISTTEIGTTDFIGTPDYMAPEIYDRKPYGISIDSIHIINQLTYSLCFRYSTTNALRCNTRYKTIPRLH